MKLTCKKYTVGDIAAFYGVSTDTVRLYDKKNLLIASEKGQKGYRIYSRSDMVSFDYILKLKQSGIPLNDINKIINHCSLSEAYDYCCHRASELDLEIQNLVEQKRNLDSLCKDILSLKDRLNDISVEYSPAFYLKEVHSNLSDARKWMKKHGFSSDRMVVYSQNNPNISFEKLNQVSLRSNLADFYLLSPIDESDIEKLKLHGNDLIWERKLCIHTRIKAVYSSENIFEDQSRMMDFVKRHNFKLKNEAIYEILFKEKVQTDEIIYYDCWISVEA